MTTELLGKAAIPNLPYEQPDGTPIRVNTDYLFLLSSGMKEILMDNDSLNESCQAAGRAARCPVSTLRRSSLPPPFNSPSPPSLLPPPLPPPPPPRPAGEEERSFRKPFWLVGF